MKIIRLIFLGLLSGFLFFSCKNHNKEQISRIDSLYQVADQLQQKLSEINVDTLKNRYIIYKNLNKYIGENITELKNDSSWYYICEFQKTNKPFMRMPYKYGHYMAEIDSSKKQLDNLKHDLMKDLITDEEFKKFYNIEVLSLNAVYNKVNSHVDIVAGQLKNYDTIYPYICKMIDNHKNKHK